MLVGTFGKQRCLDHLLDCCGHILRGEQIPGLPQYIAKLAHDLDQYIESQNEGQRQQLEAELAGTMEKDS